ncbi:MAG: DNA primase [Lachnospiraceae bacterium]|nr:DNA primase [Lachnospiraceae bacterium]
MIYSDDFVEEVRSRSDIVDVVGQYVHLEKRGANYFGLCPFHNEKTASFSVHAGKQIFHCFGCGAGGDVFKFVREYENMTFPEAVRSLAERAGMQVPEEDDSPAAKQVRDRKQTLLAINKAAASFYYHQLYQDNGKRGLEYFQNRGLTNETIRHFGLGFADMGGNKLLAHLRGQGYTDAQIIEAGLAAHDEKRGAYDKFWNRVMFPIMDASNRVIGFGGRVMGEGKPKYLNSPETPVFDKGRNLYGLNYAKNARAGHVILCEGYMDVIAMHQAGFTQAMASLGTAFTSMQANLLKRYTEEVILSYDSDEAGIKAALRAIGILREAGLRGRVLDLTPYKDPDEFIRAEGAEEFGNRLKKALDSFFFELKVAERAYDLNDPGGRTRFIREAAKKLCVFTEPIERENYLAATASRYGVSQDDLRHLVSDIASQEGIRAPAVTVRREQRRQDAATAAEEEELKKSAPQRMLLTWLTEEPALLPAVERYLSPEDFNDEMCRRVAEQLFGMIREGQLKPAAVVGSFPEEEQSRVTAILDTPFDRGETTAQREQALSHLVREIKRRAMEQEQAALDPATPDYFRIAVEGRKKIDALKDLHIKLQEG